MFTSKYFNMGKTVVTCGINEAMENKRFALEVGLALKRYAVKDWGNLSLSEVIPDGYINTGSEEFCDRYVDMSQVVAWSSTEEGLQLYFADGSGYYLE